MSGGACGDEVQSSAYFPRPDHDLRLNVAKVAYSHSNQVSRIRHNISLLRAACTFLLDITNEQCFAIFGTLKTENAEWREREN